jgi:response regulator RpfG family c-di-GMP phosphodiesterase
MKKLKGEIILIDNEEYEEDFLKEILVILDYKAEVKFFNNVKDGLEYIMHTTKQIFLIISDIHMSPMTGFDLKKMINESPELKLKAIPFIFVTNLATPNSLNAAYKYNIQGFFEKPNNFKDMTEMLSIIIKYWATNLHPHTQDGVYVERHRQ